MEAHLILKALTRYAYALTTVTSSSPITDAALFMPKIKRTIILGSALYACAVHVHNTGTYIQQHGIHEHDTVFPQYEQLRLLIDYC